MKTFETRFSYYRNLINEKLNQIAVQKIPSSFYDPVHYILESDGKRIRPILVILACEAVDGQVGQCLNSAIAIELLHNFTLVHDDIMDQDDLRRGRTTVHKKWDEATAILAGDGLVALAYQYLLKTNSDNIKEICEIFTNGIIELCEGQALDKEFEQQSDISLDQYLSMIEKKTALLLMISMEIGVIIGGGDQTKRELVKDFSRELGCAFQIQDDLLDMEKTSGKTFGSDIRQKKKTILFVHALNHSDKKTKQEIVAVYQKPKINKDDILKVRELLQKSGTLNYAREQVESRIKKARYYLEQLKQSPARQDLQTLLSLILKRKS